MLCHRELQYTKASHKNATHDIRNFWAALGKQRVIDRDEQYIQKDGGMKRGGQVVHG
jgi:hypothetical protein